VCVMLHVQGCQRYPVTSWIPAIGHPCDCVPIMLQIGTWEPITVQNFAMDVIYIMILIEFDTGALV